MTQHSSSVNGEESVWTGHTFSKLTVTRLLTRLRTFSLHILKEALKNSTTLVKAALCARFASGQLAKLSRISF